MAKKVLKSLGRPSFVDREEGAHGGDRLIVLKAMAVQQKASDEGRSPYTCGPALPGGHSLVPGACDDLREGVRSLREESQSALPCAGNWG